MRLKENLITNWKNKTEGMSTVKNVVRTRFFVILHV